MIVCAGCDKELHETAPICPHCGKPQKVGVAHLFVGGADTRPFKDDVVLSKVSTRHFWTSFAIVFGISVISWFADTDGGGLFMTTVYGSLAIATGLAVRRGWQIGAEAHLSLYGAHGMPSEDRGALIWRAIAIYIGMTILSGLLAISVLPQNIVGDLVSTALNVAGCIGISLYFAERVGWADAGDWLSNKAVTDSGQ